MSNHSTTLAQRGVAFLIVISMVMLALTSAASGSLVGDAIFVFGLMTVLWLLSVRAGTPKPTVRRVTQPAPVRVSARKGC